MNKNSINALVGALAGLFLVALMAGPSMSQFPPREECYWECGVEICNYHEDYCNYECHEICYPILRKPDQLENEPELKMAGAGGPLANLAFKNHDMSGNMAKDEGGRIGKVIKMRLENPAYETLRKGKYVLTRGSPPRGFAMFQDCLSASDKRVAGANPDFTVANRTVSTREQPIHKQV